MTIRRATCSCGQLSIDVEGEPIRVSVCHCLACQRRTGSAFGVQARFALEQVRATEGGQSYTRVADSGNTVTFRFCDQCGSTVWWRLEALGDFVAIAIGAFADPKLTAPSVSIYEARQHAWVAFGPGLAIEHLD